VRCPGLNSRPTGSLRHRIAEGLGNPVDRAGSRFASIGGMMPARKVVRIRRAATREPLLDERDVEDMLDAFALDDAELVRMDVNVPEEPAVPKSGFMRKVEVPTKTAAVAAAAPTDDAEEIEEITDGIVEGWEDGEVA
jgi:hypothetical protein